MQRLYALLLFVLLLLALPASQADNTDSVEVKLFKVQLYLAQSGDAAGQYYLAEMYEKGLGTPQNMQQALVWYKKSAELGNSKAEEKLANWEKNLENARKAKERVAEDAREAELARIKQQEEARARAAAEAARKAAEQSKAAELAKAKQQEETAKARAASEAARKAAAEEAAKAKSAAAQPAAASPKAADTKTPAAASGKGKSPQAATTVSGGKDDNPEGFNSNPCKGPQAKFLSTCN